MDDPSGAAHTGTRVRAIGRTPLFAAPSSPAGYPGPISARICKIMPVLVLGIGPLLSGLLRRVVPQEDLAPAETDAECYPRVLYHGTGTPGVFVRSV